MQQANRAVAGKGHNCQGKVKQQLSHQVAKAETIPQPIAQRLDDYKSAVRLDGDQTTKHNYACQQMHPLAKAKGVGLLLLKTCF